VRVVNLATAEYALEKRSGNLSIRVLRKEDIEAVFTGSACACRADGAGASG